MKTAYVYMHDYFAGILTETDDGYVFSYDPDYLKSENAEPVSLTLPLLDKTYKSKVLFPFFDGLIPEGWLLDIVKKNWRYEYDIRDRMSLLMVCCKDCIGAVSIQADKKEADEVYK
ncbi:HipA N-terminal domain-containing protein [Methanolapillus millepedarum]|uniref:Serine/threonine-protein kinase toxin HipA n=1 Tax=Methanolapillus millepedarum TaxID=3028296 RepID=A0AA96V2D4_9EURY|nr:Serine/threonine-protein kinase toxin HipA [Methanosarcinaceae archaeon Ac7]